MAAKSWPPSIDLYMPVLSDVDGVGALGIGEDVGVIPGALAEDVLVVDLGPVLPPLSERNTPPSAASTMAQTRSGLAGETVTPMRPSTPLRQAWRCA